MRQLVSQALPAETRILVIDSVVPGGATQNHLEPEDFVVHVNGEIAMDFLKMEAHEDRHRLSVLVTVDRHEWYAEPQLYSPDDATGLWKRVLALQCHQSHLHQINKLVVWKWFHQQSLKRIGSNVSGDGDMSTSCLRFYQS